jgi:hypothetical protein
MNGNGFRQRFTRIEGLSSIRRLPRLGKIRLGIKVVNEKTTKEYPKEVDYFVCPAEIKKVYGEKPKELNIMFPLNDPESLFPQAYKWYGSGAGLKCRGDGVEALRLNEETNKMEERECPCELLEEGKCKQRASLAFMIPSVKIGGVYQIDLSSYHSIVDINSSLDYAMAMLGGRIAMVPFILRRVPKETHNEGKKQTHYTLTLELDIPLEKAQAIRDGANIYRHQKNRYEIEEPTEDVNPEYDTKEKGAVVVPETEEDRIEREKKEAEAEEKVKADYHQSKLNEAKLIAEKEEGKHKIKDFKESKEIFKKKQEEAKQIEAELDPKALEEVFAILKDEGIMNWNQILYWARKANFQVNSVAEVKKLLVEDQDKIHSIVDAKEEEANPGFKPKPFREDYDPNAAYSLNEEEE